MNAKPRPARKERILKGDDTLMDLKVLDQIRATKQDPDPAPFEFRVYRSYSTLDGGRKIGIQSSRGGGEE